MSEYVAHFTKPGPSGRRDYDNIMSILGSGRIEARKAFGAARQIPQVIESQRVVCFSEVPLGLLGRIVKRRGSVYGVAFRKSFLTSIGGNPIWYVAKGTPVYGALVASIEAAKKEERFDSPVFDITPFIDFPGQYGNSKYHFEWEREWRCVGDVRFRPEDVSFLFIAEEDHEVAREFFDVAERDNIGPSYKCPFIDPRWDIERVQEALSFVAASE